MWYVKAQVGEECERWECLTEDQAIAVAQSYSNRGISDVSTGQMQ